jgi:type I restriction enzyme S subunit
MKSEWQKVRLGDVLSFHRGYDLPKTAFDDGDIPVAGSNSIIGYHNSATTKGPGITIGRSGNIGTPKYYSSDFWAHNTVLFVNDFKENDERFLYYFLHQFNFSNFNSGSAVPSLNRNYIYNIPVNIPPLPTQRAIAATLSCLDDKIELNNRINANLEAQAQAIFKSWFVDFEPWGGVRPKGWREVTFSEIISTTLGGDWGKDTPTGNNTQEVYCIRGADIPNVNVGNKGKMPIRFILPKNYASKRLAVGDIVVEISGGSPTQSTGRCALITQSLLDR